jgi:hypothetical protein
MTGLKSNLFSQFETCILKHAPDNFNDGIVKRSGANSMRSGERANFESVMSALGSSGWSLKAVVPDEKTGENSWIFERVLPGPY